MCHWDAYDAASRLNVLNVFCGNLMTVSYVWSFPNHQYKFMVWFRISNQIETSRSSLKNGITVSSSFYCYSCDCAFKQLFCSGKLRQNYHFKWNKKTKIKNWKFKKNHLKLRIFEKCMDNSNKWIFYSWHLPQIGVSEVDPTNWKLATQRPTDSTAMVTVSLTRCSDLEPHEIHQTESIVNHLLILLC